MSKTGGASGSVTLSRAQLYDRVWETPIIRLAAEFGLSDNGLRKICHRLEVPCPPAGWWAKKAAGKKVVALPLPEPGPGTPRDAVISSTPEQTGELKQAIQRHAAAIGEIAVPDRLVRPHPVVAGWAADQRRRKEDARRHRNQWPGSRYVVPDLTTAERRRYRILHALFSALERHGAEVIEDDRRHLFAQLCGEKIEFGVHEKSRQVTRPLTADEKRWGFWDRAGVRKELEPTGRLEFQMRVWLDQPVRKTWLETDRKPLEAALPEILATFLMIAPVLAERTRRREEEARIWAERQKQLELERQRHEQEKKRWKRFVQIAEGWRRAELAREFIAKLRTLEPSDPIEALGMAEWLDWAEAKAAESDPLTKGADRIFEDVSRITAWTQIE